MAGAVTPMAKIVRRGARIYTVDGAGREELVSTSPNADVARWLLSSLTKFHALTPVEESEEITGPVEFTVDDLLSGFFEWRRRYREDPESFRSLEELDEDEPAQVAADDVRIFVECIAAAGPGEPGALERILRGDS